MLSITILSLCVPVAVLLAIRGVNVNGKLRRVRPISVPLALGGVGLTCALGELPALRAALPSWSSSFSVVLLAYAFIDLAHDRGLVADLAETMARFIRRYPAQLAIAIAMLTAFLVNAVILSASSTCILLAPLFIPTLSRLGVRPRVASAAVLFGAWGGFLNPADAGGTALNEALNKVASGASYSALSHVVVAIVGLGLGAIVFLAVTPPVTGTGAATGPAPGAARRERPGRAAVLLLPVVLVIVERVIVQLTACRIPSQEMLCVCMLLAIAGVLGITRPPRRAGDPQGGPGTAARVSSARVLLGGATRGFSDVVMLIVAARIFVFPYTLLAGPDMLTGHPSLVLVAVPVAFGLAALIGSGDAVVTPMITLGSRSSILAPSALGGMIWLACELGRNLSAIAPATRASVEAASRASAEAGPVVEPETREPLARYMVVPTVVVLCAGCLALWLVSLLGV